MKVVLFFDGFGMRMREYAASVPKHDRADRYRPILWHAMKFMLITGTRTDYE
jgi:hypothetical protein